MLLEREHVESRVLSRMLFVGSLGIGGDMSCRNGGLGAACCRALNRCPKSLTSLGSPGVCKALLCAQSPAILVRLLPWTGGNEDHCGEYVVLRT